MSPLRLKRGALAVAAGAVALAALGSCDLPLDLSQPTTRSLQTGASETLTNATSFEIRGSYTGPGVADQPVESSGPRVSVPPPSDTTWTIDLQMVRPSNEHVTVSGGSLKVEALIVGGNAYFRGQQFLSDHMGSDAISRGFVQAAGNAWWTASSALAPRLPDFTDGRLFKAAFLGPAVTQRSDHASVDGIDAVEMSGPRADVFISSTAPYPVLYLRMNKGVEIDGIRDAQFRYDNFNKDFGLSAPTDVIDFSNLSTLPPIYTMVSVDTSQCGSPCVVSALVKNLGGMTGAKGPSVITFTLADSASGKVLGSCQAQVVPDVGFNATTTVSCTIASAGGQPSAATVTASPFNPGHT